MRGRSGARERCRGLAGGSQMAGLARLKAALELLFKGPSPAVVPAVDRRAVSMRDAKGNLIVTGDHNVFNVPPEAEAPSPLHQLPADVADFAGRTVQVERLLGMLSAPGGRAAISAVEGMGGLGKTTLAVHVAHRLTDRYPDGQIVLDMAGTSPAPLPPAPGLARVIRVFEPLTQLPEAAVELRSLYLSVLRGKRVLLIL